MCAVSYREVNEVARRIDADITVVSLEPTSIEGIFHTITTVGAMTEVEDAAIDLVESLRERLGAVEQRVTRRRDAGRAPVRVVAVEWLDPPFAVGHWAPEQVRRAGAGTCSAPMGRRRSRRRGCRRRGRPRDAVPDAMRVPSRRDDRRMVEAAIPTRIRELGAARSGQVFALDGSAYSRGQGRGSSTASRCSPRSWIPRGSWTSPRPAAGHRSRSAECHSRRPSRASGAGGRSRPGPRGPRRLGTALSGLHRQGRR